MAYKLVEEVSLLSVADAIRTKGNTSGVLLFPSGFVSAIGSLSTRTFAFIRVTVNSGNTATCVNTSTGTSVEGITVNGKIVFGVPEAGTWRVSALSGSVVLKTSDVTLSATSEGSTTDVNLARLYLVTAGSVNSTYDLTRIIRSGSNVTKATSGGILTLTAVSTIATTGVATKAKVPCGSYTNLVAEVSSVSSNTSSNNCSLAIWNDSSGVSSESAVYSAAKTYTSISGAGTFRIACTSYGSVYVGFLFKLGGSSVNVKVKNMYLE